MKKHHRRYNFFYIVILTFFLALTSAVGTTFAAFEVPGGIDAGASTPYTTANNIIFDADYGRTGGIVRTSSGEIAGTEDDTLYHTRVVAQTGDNITYSLTPPSGVTEMRIIGHFNEHYHQSAEQRLVDVRIECPGSTAPWDTGQFVETGLDIFAEAGGRNTALTMDWGIVDVSGGQINITVSANADSPDAALINAIEFIPIIEGNPVIPNVPGGIDAGASTPHTTATGVTYEADYGRTGGVVRTSSGEIAGTEDDALYHTRVVAPIGESVTYSLTPPSGVTEMQIIGHFNEHYHQSAGQRLIDVRIECPDSAAPWDTGQNVEAGRDIFAAAGGRNTALTLDWGIVDVSGGKINITISANAESPDAALINAIEFVPIILEAPVLGIDAGASTPYTCADGAIYEADYGRTGGVVRTSSGEIADTDDDTLYHTRVVAPIGESVTYSLTPPSGVTEMQIIGHFNEHYHQSAGQRFIDVWVECPGSAPPWDTRQLVENRLDIFQEAGGGNIALLRNWGTVDVSGGELVITISANADSPDAALISAIEYVY